MTVLSYCVLFRAPILRARISREVELPEVGVPLGHLRQPLGQSPDEVEREVEPLEESERDERGGQRESEEPCVAQEPARAAAGMGKALEGSGVATESEKERAAVQSAMGALARLAPCGEGQGQPAFAPPRPAASRSQGKADSERHAKPLSQTPATTLGLSPSAPSRRQ